MASAVKKAALAALGFGFVGTLATAEGRYRGYETPAYSVAGQLGAAELRDYAPFLAAEVTVAGDQRTALSRGFRVLAGYIFGGNTAAAKVAMTSPVAQAPSTTIAMTAPVSQAAEGDRWTVTFSMPGDYTRDTLPVPKDDAIRFVERPAMRQIVLQFNGLTGQARLDAKTADLRRIADGAGLTLAEGPFFYFYDDPMTLPWNRRNEVAFTVR